LVEEVVAVVVVVCGGAVFMSVRAWPPTHTRYVDRPGELRPSRAASGTLGAKDLLLKYEAQYTKIGGKEAAAKAAAAAKALELEAVAPRQELAK
jgi:hypothetical protein